MDGRGVLLITAVIVAGVAACSGPDPSALAFSERLPQDGPSPSARPGPGGAGGADGGEGTGSAPAGPDPIFGTTAFAYVDPGIAANNAAVAHGGTVEGKDCVTAGCHLDTKPWVFGGTVYSAAQGGAVVPRAEIKIVGPDGAEVGKAYTDANGNFWLSKPGTTIPAGSKVGVRKEGGAARAMATPLQPGDGGCSANRANCHGTPGTGRVFAP